MSFSAPTPPDPTQVSAAQTQYNTAAAQQQQALNSYNQTDPYGSVSYTRDPNSPSGYTVQTNLSAPNQNLLNTQFGSQALAGNTAQNMLRNSAGMYSSPYNLDAATGATADTLNRWSANYLQPIFNQQQSNTEAQLRNQGLMQGSDAYNNAKNLLARNQGDVTNQYLTMNEQNAFDQAMKQYQLPLQTEAQLFSMAGPQQPTFQQTPQAKIQPANYAGAAQNQYLGEQQNYANTWNALGKLGGAGVSLAMAPMTGGGSLAGNFLGGMFGGGNTSGGWGTEAGSPYYGPMGSR